MSYKDLFKDSWKKATIQTKTLLNQIARRYPGLRLETGYGALDDGKLEGSHTPGEPDIFVYYGPFLVCQIEITGSDKIIPMSAVWIGSHKIDYAKQSGDLRQIGYYLVYGRDSQVRYFITAYDALSIVSKPQVRNIKGTKLLYYILPVSQMQTETAFWDWLQERIEETVP